MRLPAILLASAVASWGAAASAEPVGKIRICRYPPHASSLHDHDRIPIPAGAVFVSGDDPRTGDQLKPVFELQTTIDVVLPPKPACVVAPAVFKVKPENFTLTTKYPSILPSQLTIPGPSIVGRVVADFR